MPTSLSRGEAAVLINAQAVRWNLPATAVEIAMASECTVGDVSSKSMLVSPFMFSRYVPISYLPTFLKLTLYEEVAGYVLPPYIPCRGRPTLPDWPPSRRSLSSRSPCPQEFHCASHQRYPPCKSRLLRLLGGRAGSTAGP